MRCFIISALSLLGLAWTAPNLQAQFPRQQGNLTYVYPQGTQGYYVGPQGRSSNYIVPTVTSGYFGPQNNGSLNYKTLPSRNQFNGSFNDYGHRHIRPAHRPYHYRNR